MNPDEITKAFGQLKIPKTHTSVGISNVIATNKQFRSLFVNRRLPDCGWSDVQIQHILFLFSTLDTNNKTLVGSHSNGIQNDESSGDGGIDNSRWCGVGEREGRIYSSLVAHRHFGLSHGMGRSGDIIEPQPKAVGSSALVKMTLLLALDLMRRGCGFHPKTTAPHGILLPLCTGMSISLLLGSLRDMEPKKNIVLWSRIDQKSCFKAILSAGLKCVVVPTKIESDEVVTDLDLMEAALNANESHVLAVITTSSCFAPRVSDQVDEVAKLCEKANVFHVINNAYGLQCKKTCKLINRACVVGRVDAIVCSTDKNFLVPVGGAIIVSPQKKIIEAVGKAYAGRASSSPIVDLFITLLSMGMNGYKRLLHDREDILKSFPSRFNDLACKYNERLLQTSGKNTISFAMTLDNTVRKKRDDEEEHTYLSSVERDLTNIGAMLFTRCVSGTRVVPRRQKKVIGGQEFSGYGSSVDNYPHAYLTAACAVGVNRSEIDLFFIRMEKLLSGKKISDEI